MAQLPQSPAWCVQAPEVRYHLRASLDDRVGVVSGSADIRYRHLAPDTLRSLGFSLPYNIYRPGGTGWPAKLAAGEDAWGFARVLDVRIDGGPATLTWPLAPDSSVAILALARPLAQEESVVVSVSWTARPPAAGRRVDRRGRRLNLSGWYPQVLDLTPPKTTVPFPAFAAVRADLDLPEDQVIGGTGIPLCGEPGWFQARAFPDTRVTLQRGQYAASLDGLPAASDDCGGAAPGRKRLVWYADSVSELGLVLSPSFRYEEGDFNLKPVRVLYEADEERQWGAGLATRRVEVALAWVYELGADNPWPHLTVAPALGREGHALPMLLLSETSTQAALFELLGLMFTQQVMTGGARVFTVGAAAFQTAWFFETLGRRGDYARLEREILDWDLEGIGLRPEPIPRPSLTSPCSTTSCRRTEFMLYQLRNWSADPEAIRKIFQELYRRFRLRPTVPGGFELAARGVIQPNPDTLYQQIQAGRLYDDAITRIRREVTATGEWRTTVEVERKAPGVYPRSVRVSADRDTAEGRGARLTSRETITVFTKTRPRGVLLAPRVESHDWNMLNNERRFGFRPGWLVLTPQRPRELYLDTYFTRRTARNRSMVGWAPTAWYNDAGGWTFGVRLREDYLGRFELNELWTSVGTAWGVAATSPDVSGRLRIRNPVGLRASGWSQAVDLAWEEGRAAAQAGATRRFNSGVMDQATRTLGLAVHWLTVTDPSYLDPGLYDDAGTAEVTVTGRLATESGRWPFDIQADLGGGYAYSNRGDGARGGYGRFTVAASMRNWGTGRWSTSARLYGGAVLAGDSVPRQRRLYLAGADPYQRFGSPFLRSRGSLFAGRHYHEPGGAGVRGLDSRWSGTKVVSAGVELEYAVRRRPLEQLVGRVALAAFVDGALADGVLDAGGERLRSVADAGVGVRIAHRLGATRFLTRLDFPLWVSRPEFAAENTGGDPAAFRWRLSFKPAW